MDNQAPVLSATVELTEAPLSATHVVPRSTSAPTSPLAITSITVPPHVSRSVSDSINHDRRNDAADVVRNLKQEFTDTTVAVNKQFMEYLASQQSQLVPSSPSEVDSDYTPTSPTDESTDEDGLLDRLREGDEPFYCSKYIYIYIYIYIYMLTNTL